MGFDALKRQGQALSSRIRSPEKYSSVVVHADDAADAAGFVEVVDGLERVAQRLKPVLRLSTEAPLESHRAGGGPAVRRLH